MKIVFATGNPHKLKEIKEIAGDTDIEFVLPAEGFNPVENGSTFEENSFIKAKEAARVSGMMSLADDSGLCVEALDGGPGIYSARYAETPQKRIDKLLNTLTPFKDRRAKFVCAMTLVDSEGNKIFSATGECHGEIAKKQSGTGGFGYDPVFIVENSGKTMAELSENEKNLISHRGRALREVLKYLSSL
ncbi:RdgB/HAM1 family non-canonical purine NTP pyrophosphatase [Spirochaetes bacterium]|uniref:dITP/XTP pyrophosphatase n=1 Tax=Candidatus Scatousia excrementipullorum TaxID=2840936 RepID=A0A9D9DNM2_9BACT|nr:RdgB/HAM1 family non-canonical purine NTP pyrophosphatase [Candidatus Scatousia excrementipullorum]